MNSRIEEEDELKLFHKRTGHVDCSTLVERRVDIDWWKEYRHHENIIQRSPRSSKKDVTSVPVSN
jgi:hypothetical protein